MVCNLHFKSYFTIVYFVNLTKYHINICVPFIVKQEIDDVTSCPVYLHASNLYLHT